MKPRCVWAVDDGDGQCPRDAVADLPRSRPCGCPLKSVPSCGGHVEALADTDAPNVSLCARCGSTDRIHLGWPDATVGA